MIQTGQNRVRCMRSVTYELGATLTRSSKLPSKGKLTKACEVPPLQCTTSFIAERAYDSCKQDNRMPSCDLFFEATLA